MSSTNPPDRGTETAPGPDAPRRRPHWLLVAAAAVLCPAVVVAGWQAGHVITHDLGPGAPATQEPRPLSAAPPVEASDPAQAEEFVRSAALRVDAAQGFRVVFFVHGAGTDASVGLASLDPGSAERGHGRAVFDSGSEPRFDHTFTAVDGTRVVRHGADDGRCSMAAGPGDPEPSVIEEPSDADAYLCSRGFASAKLWEVLASSEDLRYEGEEYTDLVPLSDDPADGDSQGSERVPAHRYTGTFTALVGGYDPQGQENVLSPVEETGFDLWIDTDGLPRRFVHDDGAGTGETYDVHALS
ncbi:hypothetical protein [Nocardiopsis coralli]|uniref:hypothetical protein n=1 Tax=Nocardiopsis coralli TaxID=2772213 RepID=UPI002E2C7E05|nr:hypothetical protein [Nocardiopsis coralli]